MLGAWIEIKGGEQMVGKRIIVVVIAVLLCSCLNVAAFADSVSQYTDTGGYDEDNPVGDIGIKGLPGRIFYLAPGIYRTKYWSHIVCPHCGATGPDPQYIVELPKSVSGYSYCYLCQRCTCKWVAGNYGAFLQDYHFHLDDDGKLCAYDYGIDYGFNEDGERLVSFYCSKHKCYDLIPPYFRRMSELFEFNTFWGLRVIGGDDWVEPVSTPALWETPFVPPYDSFATFEPVSVENIGNNVNDMAAIVKVVYKGFPFFVTLLTIAIACAFLIVVVKG